MRLSSNVIKTKLKFWITKEMIDEWFKNKEVFFITGFGRSGTKLLANLLNKDKSAIVFHEPIAEDFQALVEAHKSSKRAEEYIKNYRKKRMYCLVKGQNVKIYGEVNSVIMYHASALKKYFPHAKFLHIVRDGRDVIRSVMARKHYTNDGIGHHSLVPKKQDKFYKSWNNFTRFEKVCWLWVESNKRISENVHKIIKFEKIISDYEYFKENIENYLHLQIGEKNWNNSVNNPKNITKKQTIPHWKDWDEHFRESFFLICRDEMKKYGYF